MTGGPGTRRRRGGTSRPRGRSAAVLLIAVVALAGCLEESTLEVTPASLWEATISPFRVLPGTQVPLVSGQAAVIVRSGSSRVGLGLQGIDRDMAWHLYEGSCEAPGDPLLDAEDYPTLAEGTTELETTLPVPLSATGSYHIRILLDAGGLTIACGNFRLTEG